MICAPLNCLGNKNIGSAVIVNNTLMIMYPNHQAPIHRGSLFEIPGSSVETVYVSYKVKYVKFKHECENKVTKSHPWSAWTSDFFS